MKEGCVEYGETQITWNSRCADITLARSQIRMTSQGTDQLSVASSLMKSVAPMTTQVPSTLADITRSFQIYRGGQASTATMVSSTPTVEELERSFLHTLIPKIQGKLTYEKLYEIQKLLMENA
eukprot:9504401-Ditylum_brightwellii.AAC.2